MPDNAAKVAQLLAQSAKRNVDPNAKLRNVAIWEVITHGDDFTNGDRLVLVAQTDRPILWDGTKLWDGTEQWGSS